MLKDLFHFDTGDGGFELAERESGSPTLFGAWKDVEKKGEEGLRFPETRDGAYALLSRVFNSEVNTDAILRKFLIGGEIPALIAYMNGMADDAKINDFILRPLMECAVPEADLSFLSENVIRISEVKKSSDMKSIIRDISGGMTALFVEGEGSALLLETRGFEKRSVSSPENEKVVSGPNESFTEDLRTNVTLIRRELHMKELVAEYRTVGESGTRLAVLYIDGLTDRALVSEVKRRLARIRTGGFVSTGTIAQMIEDDGYSPLPQILQTERPDRVSSHILQGRAAVLVDGSPFALVMPVTFFSLMNSPEDIYLRKPLGSLIRLIRWFGALVSVLLPGYFLALALYHQGLLSTEVLSTVIASRRMVFEPIGVEMLLLLLIFQMIREAGQRVPGNIGQAIGIIGGLIMGQAAVSAHLASSVVLIIVAASGLGNFCIPDYQTQLAASYFRIAAVIAAWLAGLLGITALALLAACHIAGLRSFGVPFLAPFSPRTSRKAPTILRGNIGMHSRPDDYVNTSLDGSVK